MDTFKRLDAGLLVDADRVRTGRQKPEGDSTQVPAATALVKCRGPRRVD